MVLNSVNLFNKYSVIHASLNNTFSLLGANQSLRKVALLFFYWLVSWFAFNHIAISSANFGIIRLFIIHLKCDNSF